MVIQLLIPWRDTWRAPGSAAWLWRGTGWQLHTRRKRDIDRLIAQFHALFRQIDQEKQQRP
jgi:hypothetical protein